jgi:predicted transcriptional regulator
MTSQLIVELDDALARELEAVAPSRERRRSEFVRQALRSALDRVAEDRMRRAYQAQPDDVEPAFFDADAWEPSSQRRVPGRKRRK